MEITDVQNMVEQLIKIRNSLNEFEYMSPAEEATKNWLIVPFIEALGYNTRSPEVIPEYTCDVGTKQGERVDYAIVVNGKVHIIMECKRLDTELCKTAISQLYRYFTTSEAKIAILTNGNDYWFFTDVNKQNIMDTEPYLKLKISNSTVRELESLSVYAKENIDKLDIKKDIILNNYKKTCEKFLDDLFNKNIPSWLIENISSRTEVDSKEFEEYTQIFKRCLINKINTLSNVKIEDKEGSDCLDISNSLHDYSKIIIPNDRDQTLYNIWTLLIEYLKTLGKQDMASRSPWKYNWYDFHVNPKLNISAVINYGEVMLTIYVKTAEYYDALKLKKELIEKEFGDTLKWDTSRPEAKAKRILYTKTINVYEFNKEEQFIELFDWFINTYNNLITALVNTDMLGNSKRNSTQLKTTDVSKSNIKLNYEYTFNDYSDGDWTFHKIGYAKIFGETYDNISSPKLLIKVVEKSLTSGYATEEELLTLGARLIKPKSAEDNKFALVDNSNLTVNTHYSITDIMKQIERILNKINKPFDSVKLSFID